MSKQSGYSLGYIAAAGLAAVLMGAVGPKMMVMQFRALVEKPKDTLGALPCALGTCGGALAACVADTNCRNTVGKHFCYSKGEQVASNKNAYNFQHHLMHTGHTLLFPFIQTAKFYE